MKKSLEFARQRVKAAGKLAEFDVHQDGNELHLSRGDVSFARLIPDEEHGQWRIEYFHNEKRWECIDFTGSLEACLDLLEESPHYLYWEA